MNDPPFERRRKRIQQRKKEREREGRPFPSRGAKLHKVQLEESPPGRSFSLTFPEWHLECLRGRTFSRHQHVSQPLFHAGGIYRLTLSNSPRVSSPSPRFGPCVSTVSLSLSLSFSLSSRLASYFLFCLFCRALALRALSLLFSIILLWKHRLPYAIPFYVIASSLSSSLS